MRPCPPPLAQPSRPSHPPPAGACDAHCHVFGPAALFPYSEGRGYTPQDAPKERLFALHAHLGIARRVIVQASCHGTDNEALLDALRAAPESSRGIAGVAPDVPDAELDAMDALGVRGVRFNLLARLAKLTPPEAISALAERLAPRGWHLVLHFEPDQLGDLMPFIAALPVPVVIDHMARLDAQDIGGAEYAAFLDLVRMPHVWTKVSGSERGSRQGEPYEDMVPAMRAVADAAPDRALWGTDWPHPVMSRPMPDDGKLVDLVWRAFPESAVRQAILVDNPARLYGFGLERVRPETTTTAV